ncbi:UNKNOWN [Stylonychia lemnae]|uniref:VLIG-type G domain-containing protein n=1 Tax=Stylonychia lemnae TaxID=5949 RepID=A0A078AHJ0_STYLE|nr:UNKNOWN [Stylonychia lemnae]|eukprot:CDW80962.1 UNKNOWN [Stylonychia lemnae]
MLQPEAINNVIPILEEAGIDSLEFLLESEQELLEGVDIKPHVALKITSAAVSYKQQVLKEPDISQNQYIQQSAPLMKSQDKPNYYGGNQKPYSNQIEQPKAIPQTQVREKFVAPSSLQYIQPRSIQQQGTAQYLIYESFQDKGSEYKMSKTRLNENDFIGLISNIKAKDKAKLQVVGYYGDFNQCLIYAQAFLQAENMPNPLIKFDEGLIAFKNKDKIAFIYKIDPTVYFLREQQRNAVESSQVSTYIRYIIDACEIVIIVPPKGLRVRNDNTTPYQEQMNSGYILEEVQFSQDDSNRIQKISGAIGLIRNLNLKQYNAFKDNSKHFPSAQFKYAGKKELIQIKFSNDIINGQKWWQTNYYSYEQLKSEVIAIWPLFSQKFQNIKHGQNLKSNIDFLLRGFVPKNKINDFEKIAQKSYDQYIKEYVQLEDEIKKEESQVFEKLFKEFFEKLQEFSCSVFVKNKEEIKQENDAKKSSWLPNIFGGQKKADCTKKCGLYDFKKFQLNFKKYIIKIENTQEGGSKLMSINWELFEKCYRQFYGEDDKNNSFTLHQNQQQNITVLIEKLQQDFLSYNKQQIAKFLDLRKKTINNVFKDIEPLINKYRNNQEITVEIRFISANVMVDTLKQELDWSVQNSQINVLKYQFDNSEEHGNNIVMSQMHFITEQSGFIVFQDSPQDKSTLYFFNYMKRDSEVFKKLSIQLDKNSLFAFDSDTKRIFYCDNKDKIAALSTFDKEGNILETNEIQLYNQNIENQSIQNIVDAIILPKHNKVIILNEKNFIFELCLQDKKYYITIAFSKGNAYQGELKKFYVQPQNGGNKFFKIQSTSDGSKIALQTENSLDIFDNNWERIKALPLKKDFIFFKIFADKMHHFVIIFHQGSTECFQIGFLAKKSLSYKHEEYRNTRGEGNPILNFLYDAFKKYGPHSDFLGCPSKTQVIFSDENNPQNATILASYFKLLNIKSSVNFQIEKPEKLKQPNFINNWLSIIDPIVLEMILLSRVPLHLATIENSTLIPLQNGKNISEIIAENKRADKGGKQFGVKDVIPLVEFGLYEKLMASIQQSMKVVCIVGRQSSGKSYGLNRIFGTRFNVAATRCTDGIWMSVVAVYYEKQKPQYFLVMDCEGLFSERRNEDEEIKLCLVLSAISDMMILNQDLSFNRNLNQLFHKFSENAGRIQGDKLFKGKLMMLIRDVRADEAGPAYQELKSNMEQLQISKQDKFFGAVFQGQLIGQCLSYFQQKIFNQEIQFVREHYFLSSQYLLQNRWDNGKDLVDSLKVVLTQVFLNDGSNIDDRKFNLQCEDFRKSCQESFYSGGEFLKVKDLKNLSTIKIQLEIEGKMINFEVDQSEIQLDEIEKNSQQPQISERVFQVFENFAGKKTDENQVTWHKALVKFIDSLLDHRAKLVMEIFLQKMPNDGKFENTVILNKSELEEFTKTYLEEMKFCNKLCKNCKRTCALKNKHSVNCKCKTNHKCYKVCQKSKNCRDQGFKCDINFGHDGEHSCSDGNHNCIEQCQIPECTFICQHEIGHADKHKCGNQHACPKKCQDSKCERTCMFEYDAPHDQHLCGEEKCIHQCSLCDRRCMFPNHLHQELIQKKDSKNLEFRQEDGKVEQLNFHICENDHQCKNECQINGVCDKKYESIEGTWKNEKGETKYKQFKQKVGKNQCQIRIQKYKQQHNGSHNCGKPKHDCDQKCPECSGLCSKEYGHQGLHSTNSHVNKMNCVMISKNNEDKILINENGNIREYKQGGICEAEQCSLSCQRRGRSHVHLKKCQGGDQCQEVKNKAVAKHSTQEYAKFKGQKFDEMLCQSYWNSLGWELPLDESQLKLVHSCNYQCTHESHAEDKQYCDQQKWHDGKHSFKCEHADKIEEDVSAQDYEVIA